MKPRFYRVIRDLHLYLGLFSSPFVLVFATSVFFLVHGWLPRIVAETSNTRAVSGLRLPLSLQTLSGRPLIDALRETLDEADVHGEVGFVRHLVAEEKMIVPVTIPGRATMVTIHIPTREATVVSRETGLADAMATLHRSPGEHAPAIRMNWVYMKLWRWLADTTACLILFISVSGVYLWYVMRAERSVGFILILAGALSFLGLAYALSH
jgi:hypothetical protein